MVEYELMIAKAAERVEKDLEAGDIVSARERFFDLVEDVDKDDDLSEYEEIFAGDNSISDDSDKSEEVISTIRSLKYRYIAEAMEDMSGVDLYTLGRLSFEIDESELEEYLNDDRTAKFLYTSYNPSEFPEGLIKSEFIDRFSLEITESDLPTGLQHAIGYLLLENRARKEMYRSDMKSVASNLVDSGLTLEKSREAMKSVGLNLDSAKAELSEIDSSTPDKEGVETQISQLEELRRESGMDFDEDHVDEK